MEQLARLALTVSPELGSVPTHVQMPESLDRQDETHAADSKGIPEDLVRTIGHRSLCPYLTHSAHFTLFDNKGGRHGEGR